MQFCFCENAFFFFCKMLKHAKYFWAFFMEMLKSAWEYICRGATLNGALKCLLRGVIGKWKSFGFNHKIMIKIQELPPNIMVTRKPNGLRKSG